MSNSPPQLDILRQRIDVIDDRIHDLLMERAAVVAQVGAAKKGANSVIEVPGREASIMRRLLGRHDGSFPAGVLVRLWREIIGSAIALQSEFSVAVAVSENAPEIWDLARDHYGSQVTMTACHNAGEVLRVLAEGRASSGVVVAPDGGPVDPWWRSNVVAAENGPRVTARLPFASRGNARGKLDALVLSRFAGVPAGDRSLYALEIEAEVSRGSLHAMLNAGGVPVNILALERSNETSWAFIELGLFVPPDDPRLAQMLAGLGERQTRASALGFYASPLVTKV